MDHKCMVCGGETVIIHHKLMKTGYDRCMSCQFIFKDSNVRLTKSQERKIYDSHNNSINDPKYQAYFRSFIEMTVQKHCEKGASGLDFGSGPEPVLATLLERDYGFLMDIHDLHYAPEKIYEGRQYDFIVSTEVMEHLRNPMEAMRIFRKHLKNEGILAIMTNFHQNDDDFFQQWHYVRDKSHVSFYTPATFGAMAALTGFRVLCHDSRKAVVLC